MHSKYSHHRKCDLGLLLRWAIHIIMILRSELYDLLRRISGIALPEVREAIESFDISQLQIYLCVRVKKLFQL